jgi:quercetin dioxygenase-like cupin family protein
MTYDLSPEVLNLEGHHMRRTTIVVAAAVTSVLSVTTAFATPPTGEVKFKDMARAQAVESATVPISPGNNFASGSYSVAPGSETGWRRLPGTSVLAVNKGKLMLHGGEGCAAKEYGTGQAAVVPAGTYMVHNAGSEPLEFFGWFFDQVPGAPKPLAEGPTESTPANCTGVMAAGAAPSGVSLTDPAVGTLVPGAYGYGEKAVLQIEAGKDVYASWLDISPEWSSGWLAHHPAANIVSTGELSYVEARDGKCDESEVYHAGQAFYHPAHRHMAFNKGKEHVILWTMYFDLPHETPLPVIGNTITAVDFTQAPPADCPRLR